MSDMAKCEGIKHHDIHWGSWIDDHCFDCARRSFPSGTWQVWMTPWQGDGKCAFKIKKMYEVSSVRSVDKSFANIHEDGQHQSPQD